MNQKELATTWWNTLPQYGQISKEYYMSYYDFDDKEMPNKIVEVWLIEVFRKMEPSQVDFIEQNIRNYNEVTDKISDLSKYDRLRIHQMLWNGFDFKTQEMILEAICNT